MFLREFSRSCGPWRTGVQVKLVAFLLIAASIMSFVVCWWYNDVVSVKDTESFENIVVVLFIMGMDEQLLSLMRHFAPQ